MNLDKINSLFHKHKREITAYVFCEILCILTLIWILRLWNADLSVPFAYWSDSLVMESWFKCLIDNPWWTQNAFLGMPFGQMHYDFPLTNTLDFIIIRILGLLFHNSAISLNLFYLLTFLLTAFTSLYVFRAFQASLAVWFTHLSPTIFYEEKYILSFLPIFSSPWPSL
jgi:hypothetical protein